MATVLVVDDDEVVLGFICHVVECAGHEALRAASGEAALELVSARELLLGAAVVDVKLPGIDGVTLVGRLRRDRPGLPCVVVTGFLDYPIPVQAAFDAGPFTFLSKPLRFQALLKEIQRSIAERIRPETRGPSGDRDLVGAENTFEGIVGASPAMRTVFAEIARVAPTRQTVLIQGETGTGKELVAKAIHARSGRRGRFVALNCAAAGPDSLLESELFGHERGAYTGAVERSAGWIESAQAGTLFLDEVADLSSQGQAKLLRVIEQRELQRLGGRHVVSVDVRFIAATNQPLEHAVSEHAFRADLYYRLNAFEINIPPLRQRIGDLHLLIDHLLPDIVAELGTTMPRVSEDALVRLGAWAWPGNIRELRHVLARACSADSDLVIDEDDLPERFRQGVAVRTSMPGGPGVESSDETLSDATTRLERRLIEQSVARHPSLADAARALGLSDKELYRKRVAHGLAPNKKARP